MPLFSSLNGSFLEPSQGGTPKTCVVLLHGLGSNGANLMDLGHAWKDSLPSTSFFSPNAPFPYEVSGSSFELGYQWFGYESQHPTHLEKGIRQALPYLDAYIKEIMEVLSLSCENIALAGFSQGAMMALAFGLEQNIPLAGILSYSGGLFGNFLPPSPPPICLVHGDQDFVVPPQVFFETKRFLKEHHIPFQSHLLKNLSHTINEEGIQIGANFLRSCFQKEVF